MNPFRRNRKEANERVVIPFALRPRPDQSASDLARLIEGEIIPRLLLTQEASVGIAPSLVALQARDSGVARFAERVISEELQPLLAESLARMDAGETFQGLCFDLFAPTACRLGEWWIEDRITFTDVTIGLCRLQQLVHELSDRYAPRDPGPQAPALLLAAAPGEQHVFGMVLMAEAFRQGGWRVTVVTETAAPELIERVRQERFAAVGVSLTDERFYPATLKLASKLRSASANPSLALMVGGRAFAEAPERVAEIGADIFAQSAQEALAAADSMIRQAATLP